MPRSLSATDFILLALHTAECKISSSCLGRSFVCFQVLIHNFLCWKTDSSSFFRCYSMNTYAKFSGKAPLQAHSSSQLISMQGKFVDLRHLAHFFFACHSAEIHNFAEPDANVLLVTQVPQLREPDLAPVQISP